MALSVRTQHAIVDFYLQKHQQHRHCAIMRELTEWKHKTALYSLLPDDVYTYYIWPFLDAVDLFVAARSTCQLWNRLITTDSPFLVFSFLRTPTKHKSRYQCKINRDMKRILRDRLQVLCFSNVYRSTLNEFVGVFQHLRVLHADECALNRASEAKVYLPQLEYSQRAWFTEEQAPRLQILVWPQIIQKDLTIEFSRSYKALEDHSYRYISPTYCWLNRVPPDSQLWYLHIYSGSISILDTLMPCLPHLTMLDIHMEDLTRFEAVIDYFILFHPVDLQYAGFSCSQKTSTVIEKLSELILRRHVLYMKQCLPTSCLPIECQQRVQMICRSTVRYRLQEGRISYVVQLETDKDTVIEFPIVID